MSRWSRARCALAPSCWRAWTASCSAGGTRERGCRVPSTIFCVIRGPNIDKESMEHFEMRTHKRLIDILDPGPKTIDALMRLDLPSGVDIEIKL